MLRRTLVLLTVLVVAGAALAACGGDDDDGRRRGGGGSNRGSGADAPLVGTQWVLDQGASRLGVAAASTVVTAQFASDGRLTGNGGCNQYNAAYVVDGSRLTVPGPIASTRIACDTPVMQVEDAYLRLLAASESYDIEGSVLTIETSSGGPLVYDRLDPEEALAGDWTVVNFYRPDAIVSPVVGSTLTATFESGQVSGESGCNRYSGPYEVDGTAISIGPLASTLRACADPAIDEQEGQLLAALQLARSYSFDGGNLTLLRDDGGIAVTLQRA